MAIPEVSRLARTVRRWHREILDPLAEQALFAEVRRLAGERTVLLITHRMASARLADRVVVLDLGRISESGTHDELLDRRGTYHRLFTAQAHSYTARGNSDR